MSTSVPKIQAFERSQERVVPPFRVGDTVKVHYLIREGQKERIQVFQGVVIARSGGHGAKATFTVRKVSFGVGVERIFPIHSPRIERLEVVTRGHVRRSKLYFLRERAGKKARLGSTRRQADWTSEIKDSVARQEADAQAAADEAQAAAAAADESDAAADEAQPQATA